MTTNQLRPEFETLRKYCFEYLDSFFENGRRISGHDFNSFFPLKWDRSCGLNVTTGNGIYMGLQLACDFLEKSTLKSWKSYFEFMHGEWRTPWRCDNQAVTWNLYYWMDRAYKEIMLNYITHPNPESISTY